MLLEGTEAREAMSTVRKVIDAASAIDEQTAEQITKLRAERGGRTMDVRPR